MSEAVRRLIRRARDAVLTLEDEGYGNTPARLSAAIAAVEAELNRTPDVKETTPNIAELHEALKGLLRVYQAGHRETTPEEIAAEYAIAKVEERA